MSQSNRCACDPSHLVMLPVRGFGLAVDPSGLVPAPAPTPICRKRVDQDMHIYINGNLSESGDGLTPETAVKSYQDAVLTLSRYDGCNLYGAHLHFLPLEDPEASYQGLTVFPGTYSTFTMLCICGESHETTSLGYCSFHMGTRITVSNVSMMSLTCIGSYTYISENVAFKPDNVSYVINVNYGGCLYIQDNAKIYFHSCSCAACIKITGSMVFLSNGSRFYTAGNITASVAFLYAQFHGAVSMGNTVDFSGCTSVAGKKYRLLGLSYIHSNGVTLPGNQAPMVENGSLYV